ncbi:MAG: hypothetical protein EA351_06675 [Gemmatimonadales bacterium]|nr:MAG: hypothetical protein EA351_06675 [Gemmatimonadales bacterium]
MAVPRGSGGGPRGSPGRLRRRSFGPILRDRPGGACRSASGPLPELGVDGTRSSSSPPVIPIPSTHEGNGVPAIRSALLILLVLVSACRGGDTGEALPGTVQIAVTPTPPITGPALVVVEIHDDAGAPVTGAEVEVEGTMDHAGMVPVRETARDEGEGRYRVQAFEFTMGGDWILLAHITLPDGTTGVHRTRVRVASGNPSDPPNGSSER